MNISCLATRIRENLSWVGVLLRVISSFQTTQGANLQKFEISRSNFTEMKSEMIFYRRVISHGFWCNYPIIKS